MTDFKFYKFVEDFRPSGTLARECNYLGEVYNPTSTARKIKAGFNRPAGASAGYVGLCYRGTFYWGPCPDLSCDEAASAIDLGTPPEATVNEAYERLKKTVNDSMEAPYRLDDLFKRCSYARAYRYAYKRGEKVA